jgi:hypothetical protein
MTEAQIDEAVLLYREVEQAVTIWVGGGKKVAVVALAIAEKQ